MLKKKIWANFQRTLEIFTQKLSLSSQKYGFRIRGSEIRDPKKTYSGSRILGSKKHRIPDPDPQHWQIVKVNMTMCLCGLCRKLRSLSCSRSCCGYRHIRHRRTEWGNSSLSEGESSLGTITVVVTATPAIKELIEGILVFLGCIVRRVERNMRFFLFNAKKLCLFWQNIYELSLSQKLKFSR